MCVLFVEVLDVQVVVPEAGLIQEMMIRVFTVGERAAFIVNIVLGLFQNRAQYVMQYAIPMT